ncbi:Hypothetical protein NTJ_00789 [Nesidiocoris tenuis]|uniref:Uncharacterized protein n=1 Tax=Nesidiocoris tenuis TaxID=355587 RepID=A0ABN7A7P6_9HEMI|nr:Hypothetical protein NTJ_00789 [Nesidiocoris tenuis]
MCALGRMRYLQNVIESESGGALLCLRRAARLGRYLRPAGSPGLHSPVRGRGDANGPKGSRIIPFFLPGMQMKPMAGSGKKIRGRWRGEYGTMAAGARKCADMTRSRDPMCPRTLRAFPQMCRSFIRPFLSEASKCYPTF